MGIHFTLWSLGDARCALRDVRCLALASGQENYSQEHLNALIGDRMAKNT